MNFKVWLESIRTIPVAKDSFLHFTPMSRAKQIVDDGMLLMRPPFKKFGTDSVDAISVTFGRWVPGTQVTHISATKDDPIVAVWFKTKTLPYAGYPEEVKWDKDVMLINPKIIPQAKARSMLTTTNSEEDYEIEYA